VLLDNPKLFDEAENNDAEFNILALFILNEKLKGAKSFFKPYLDAVQSHNTLFEWSNRALLTIENKQLLMEFQQVQEEMEKAWIYMKYVL
jgi:hypothetical protein